MSLLFDIGTSLLGSNAKKKAGSQVIGEFDKFETGATNALNTSRDAALGYYQPYMEGGAAQFGAAQNMLAPGFQYSPSDPSYAFRLRENENALIRNRAATGGAQSGGTLKALSRYAQDYASTEFGKDFDRRNALAQYGLQAAQGGAQVQSGYGREMVDVLDNAARGRSTGYGMKAGAKADFWGNVGGAISGAEDTLSRFFEI
jgi:hypothetical protein